MKRLFVLFILGSGMSVHCWAQDINTLSEAEKREGWKLLFNGKSLSGWKTFNGKGVSGWKVVDGILYNSGVGSDHGGDIITQKQYKDFELSFEWKATEKSNSGVFYRVREKIVDAIYNSGPEYQLLDDAGRPSSGGKRQAVHATGASYAMYAPVMVNTRPVGEWNQSTIVVRGGYVEHWLNGEKVVNYELWTEDWKTKKQASKWKDQPFYGMAKKGHIGLQDHGGLTMFRNIKIRSL